MSEDKEKPLQSSNISIARWPQGWSVSGFYNQEKCGYAKCETADELLPGVKMILEMLTNKMKKDV